MRKTIVLPVLLGMLLLAGEMTWAQKISPGLQRLLEGGKAGDSYLCWICLAGKPGPGTTPALGPRAMERRQKAGRSLSYGDLPVSADYLSAIRRAGVRIRVVSPWLNAVSAELTSSQVKNLAAQAWVSRLDLVARFSRGPLSIVPDKDGSKGIPALDYGFADAQIKLLRINDLHQKGYTGSSVRILVIDTGFDREHEALQRTGVLAERDFQRLVHPRDQYGDEDTLYWRPDSITSFEPEQDTSRVQTQHGSAMLSIIGGYRTGSLIGSAYNADFVLAKTEKYNGSDFSQEEDWWVAAVQWGDSLGVDIVSSSLGYRYWSDTVSYSYSQMDGRTAFCSRAADSAASRGIMVVNSQGNIGSFTTRPDTCILAPADAESILSVGGVWPSSGDWAFSTVTGKGPSAGPAADSLRIRRLGGSDSLFIRRIKPDIAAAWQTAFANNMDTVNYSQILNGTGTSGAAALTAGLCALLLEAHPHWGPAQLMEALKYSGNNRATAELYLAHPESIGTDQSEFAGVASGHSYYIDNTGTTYDFFDLYRVGWGVPDGLLALNYTAPEVVLPDDDELLDPYPNPVKPGAAGIYLPYFLARDSYQVTIGIYSLDGRQVRVIDCGSQLAGEYPGQRDVVKQRKAGRPGGFWDLKDSNGNPVPSGLYLVVLSTGWNQSVKKVVVIR
jgi:hypothetical protein